FPAVTLCNVNPLRRDRLHHLFTLNAQTRMTLFEGEQFETFQAWENQTDGLAILKFLINYLNRNNIEHIADMGFNLTDIYHFSPLFGNCYTFNPAYLNHSNAVAQGFLEGLDVQFFIHQDQYLYPGTQGAGVSVTVHKADIYPMPEVNGVFAQPGTHTLIEYKRKNIKRIKSPHGKCRTTPLKETYLNFHRDYSYNAVLCRKLCEQRYVLSKCNCVALENYYFQWIIVDNKKERLKLCEFNNECLKKVYYSFNYLSTMCAEECLPVCEYTDYDLQISQLSHPSMAHREYIEQRLQKFFENLTEMAENNVSAFPNNWYNDTINVIKENLVRISIHPGEFIIQEIIESPKYSTEDIVGNFGGHLGLLVGVGLISFTEFIVLLFLCIQNGMNRRKRSS
ncbi:unnamed protein product, partial [Didymodactylos carnosus]